MYKRQWFASTVAEVQAGKAWKEKDYQKVADIIDQVLKRFPRSSITPHAIVPRSSSPEADKYGFVRRQARQPVSYTHLRLAYAGAFLGTRSNDALSPWTQLGIQ